MVAETSHSGTNLQSEAKSARLEKPQDHANIPSQVNKTKVKFYSFEILIRF